MPGLCSRHAQTEMKPRVIAKDTELTSQRTFEGFGVCDILGLVGWNVSGLNTTQKDLSFMQSGLCDCRGTAWLVETDFLTCHST